MWNEFRNFELKLNSVVFSQAQQLCHIWVHSIEIEIGAMSIDLHPTSICQQQHKNTWKICLVLPRAHCQWNEIWDKITIFEYSKYPYEHACHFNWNSKIIRLIGRIAAKHSCSSSCLLELNYCWKYTKTDLKCFVTVCIEYIQSFSTSFDELPL